VVTDILQNVFCVQQKKEIHTGLEQQVNLFSLCCVDAHFLHIQSFSTKRFQFCEWGSSCEITALLQAKQVNERLILNDSKIDQLY